MSEYTIKAGALSVFLLKLINDVWKNIFSKVILLILGLFRAAVPSGASTGIYEAVEMRDGGADFMGKGNISFKAIDEFVVKKFAHI